MTTKRSLRAFTSVLLTPVLMISTLPVFATDTAPDRTALGFITGVGSVQLRGVAVNYEGTLFPGDEIRTGSMSHARLKFVNGSQIELFGATRSALMRTSDRVRMDLTAGHLAFNVSANPLTISLPGFEIRPAKGTTGGVAFLTDDYVGIRVMAGAATVLNTRTQDSLIVATGNVNVINLKTGKTSVSLTELASVGTPSLPVPGTAPPQLSGRTCCSPVQWGIIIGAIGAGAATALFFVLKDSSPSEP